MLALLLGCTGPVSPDAAPLDTSVFDTDDRGLDLSIEQVGPRVDEASVERTPIATVDVLVIGGGVAGMAAMIEAQSLGAQALLIEREGALGGAAYYATAGAMLFSGTPIQEDAGIADGPAVLLADWSSMTGGDPGDDWVARYAEDNVPMVFDWLIDMGATFSLSDELQDGDSQPRMHLLNGAGVGLVGLLAGRIPSASVMLGSEATALVMGSDGLEGALLSGGDGTEVFIAASSVVVATGGFLRDLSLVSWADPALDTAAVWMSSSPGADGSGHRMLDALGADWRNPSAIGTYAHGVPDVYEPGEENVLGTIDEALWVNTDGEVFLSSVPLNSYRTGQAVIEQPGQLAWAIFEGDDRPADTAFFDPVVPPGTEPSLVTVDALLAAKMAFEGDTPAALAAAAGLSTLSLPDAVSPLLAVRIAPVLAKSFGGIAVDGDSRVLAGGAPLPGVYAAGELTGMAGGSLVGEYGFTGSLSAVLLSGRVAGQAAAE